MAELTLKHLQDRIKKIEKAMEDVVVKDGDKIKIKRRSKKEKELNSFVRDGDELYIRKSCSGEFKGKNVKRKRGSVRAARFAKLGR